MYQHLPLQKPPKFTRIGIFDLKKPSGNTGSKKEGGNVVVNIDLCNMQQCLCDLHIHT
jgi:hypothetical protein